MARPPATSTLRRSFVATVISSANLYASVESYLPHSYDGFSTNPLHPKQARRVVALSFQSMVAAWEDFVQGLFVRYMVGAASPSGYRPSLRLGTCSSIRHAVEVLTGQPGFDLTRRYLSWTKWSDVTALAKLHFTGGRPFTSVHEDLIQALNDAHVIRNRVAHTSAKARRDFLQVARRFLGLAADARIGQGYDVGTLMIETTVRGFGKMDRADNYFLQYCNLYCDLADVLCPSREE